METKQLNTKTKANNHGMDRSRYHAVIDAMKKLGPDYTYEEYREFMKERGFILSGGNV